MQRSLTHLEQQRSFTSSTGKMNDQVPKKRWGKRFRFLLAFCLTLSFSLSFPILRIVNMISMTLLIYFEVAAAIVLIILSIAILLHRKETKTKGGPVLLGIYKSLITIPLMLTIISFPFPHFPWQLIALTLSWRIGLLILILDDLFTIYIKHRRKFSSSTPIIIH